MYAIVNILAGFFTAWLSAPSDGSFIGGLVVPPILRAAWTPPGFVFAIVWNIAFYVLAKEYTFINPSLKWTHFLLIHSWTPLFFGLHMYRTSLVVLFAVFITSVWIAFIRFLHVEMRHGEFSFDPAEYVDTQSGENQVRFHFQITPPKMPKPNTLFWICFITWLAFAASLNLYATSSAVQHGYMEGSVLSCPINKMHPSRIADMLCNKWH